MTGIGILQIVIWFGLVVLLTKPFGSYMARVFSGERTFLTPVLRPVERLFYRMFGVDENEDMPWTTYGAAALMSGLLGFGLTYALLRLQGFLPFNPQHFGAKQMTLDQAFNTAVSFMTNTNWQSYTPEQTVRYFSIMVALAVHNWVSAAAGIAVAIAIIRGFARHAANGLGNFWVDLTRGSLYVLLPICVVFALFLVWQGVPQNFAPYTQAATLEGAKQTIAQGPIASQEVIKMLGTNGGGFLNANSAHPFENPTPLTNFVELLLYTPYYNTTQGIDMLAGRFFEIIPLLAMAGVLVRKRLVPVSAGTLRTDSVTFALMLAAVVPIVGAIEYFPALALGPVVEQLQMLAGKLF